MYVCINIYMFHTHQYLPISKHLLNIHVREMYAYIYICMYIYL